MAINVNYIRFGERPEPLPMPTAPLLAIPIEWRLHRLCIDNSPVCTAVEERPDEFEDRCFLIQVPVDHVFTHLAVVSYQIKQFSRHMLAMYAIEFDYLGPELHALAQEIAYLLGHLMAAKKLAWACPPAELVTYWADYHYVREFSIHVPAAMLEIVTGIGDFSFKGVNYTVADRALHQFNHLAQAIIAVDKATDVVALTTRFNELRHDSAHLAEDPKNLDVLLVVREYLHVKAEIDDFATAKRPFFVNTAMANWRLVLLECLLRTLGREMIRVHRALQWLVLKQPRVADPRDDVFCSWLAKVPEELASSLHVLADATTCLRAITTPPETTPKPLRKLDIEFVSWSLEEIHRRTDLFASIYEDYFLLYFSYCFPLHNLRSMLPQGLPRQLMVTVPATDGSYITADDQDFVNEACTQMLSRELADHSSHAFAHLEF